MAGAAHVVLYTDQSSNGDAISACLGSAEGLGNPAAAIAEGLGSADGLDCPIVAMLSRTLASKLSLLRWLFRHGVTLRTTRSNSGLCLFRSTTIGSHSAPQPVAYKRRVCKYGSKVRSSVKPSRSSLRPSSPSGFPIRSNILHLVKYGNTSKRRRTIGEPQPRLWNLRSSQPAAIAWKVRW